MSRPVDVVVAGLGNPEIQYATTRHNDYLANAMQSSQEENNAVKPVFYRRFDLAADIRDTIFSTKTENGSSSVTKSLRVVLVKPLMNMNESGVPVQRVLQYYGITDTKKLIVVCDDLNTLPGSLMIQGGGLLAAMQGHKGIESIANVLGTTEFIRFRLGIGRPPNESTTITQWVLGSFTKENREMNLFGHLLHLTTHALYDYSIHQDLKKIKKKYAQSKKLPNKLKEMESLIFPIDLHGT
ncbi:1003_t:CDS:2 [Ambispora leptoticha]|uniref:1003_t:CDS:1 n=1 Tax=Ambispora leptoticha TaxID=144679 RepID=A0A9N9AJE7_9GLOM|nr:1003_t:CDS:2 [Ambispora leptoticha]